MYVVCVCVCVCAVPNVTVLCSALIPCFPGVLLMYCLSDFVMFPVAPNFTDITSLFALRMRSISVVSML